MKSTAKAIAMMRGLKEKIGFRIAGSATIDTIREAFDANGYPMMWLSDGGVETSTNPCILLRCKPIDAVSKDIFGSALVAFSPSVLEFSYEVNGTPKPYASAIDIALVLFECSKIGVKINEYEYASGTACTEANLDIAVAAGPTQSLEFDVCNPMKGM